MTNLYAQSVNGHFKGRGRNYLTLLACPVDGASLAMDDNAVRCTADPAHVYPFENRILRLMPDDQRDTLAARSDQHEAHCAAQGWQTPDEAAFKALPQSGLDGYPEGYWPHYAAATALLWRFLEAIRLANGGLPVGPMGEAAILGAGMGWLAYGLDVAGYTTLALDAHAGSNHGLGVYPIARYMRVQADPSKPPLAREAFDVLIFQKGLPGQPDRTLDHAVHGLRAGGTLVVMDAEESFADEYGQTCDRLQDAGLHLMDAPQRDGWRARLSTLRDRMAGREADTPPLIVAHKLT